jgi:2-keto-4-pentenoate hydratase
VSHSTDAQLARAEHVTAVVLDLDGAVHVTATCPLQDVDTGDRPALGVSAGFLFGLRRPLVDGVGSLAALESIAWVAGALEVTHLDGSSGAPSAVLPGSRLVPLDRLDLPLLGMMFELDGELLTTAAGAEVLGHPVEALRHAPELASTSSSAVYVGRLVALCRVEPGSRVTATFHHLGTVEYRRP